MSTNPNPERLKQIIEGALLAAGRPLGIDQILALFLDEEQPSRDEIRAAVESLQADCASRGVELVEVASGYRFQVKSDLARWIANLYEERPSRYSRATLETLALIAYRQPITRSEIEDVRGVAVSSNIVKSLLERDWVRVIGYRDVPGKPALYGTTKGFLDYFGLKSLSDLPPLAEIRSIEAIERELAFGLFDEKPSEEAANEASDESDDAELAESEAIATAAVAMASDELDDTALMEEADSLAESADDEEIAENATLAEDVDDTELMEEADSLAEAAEASRT